jgi:hypothetical protein
MKYFGLAMSLLYVLAGCGFLFTDLLIDLIPLYRVPLGALLAGYGVIRMVLWWRKYANGSDAA